MADIVLITGCSSGIGKATALYLASRDYTVYATARKQEDLKKLVEDGKKIGKQIYGAQLDVTDAGGCQKIVNAIIKKEGKIDVLINNAGYGQFGAIEELAENKLRVQMDVNFFGTARLMQLVIPHMRAAQSGKIVNMSSVAGRIGFALASAYNASKFAVEGLSEAARAELKPFNIDVILIEPGQIKTRFAETGESTIQGLEAAKDSPYHPMMVEQRNIWARLENKAGMPEDVAQVIYEAIISDSPKARYPVTGMAKQALFMKKVMPEGIFEKMMSKR